jgi:putative iron-dependent peroxidase
LALSGDVQIPLLIPAKAECERNAIELACNAEDGPRYNAPMYTPQAGIFALGTSSHTYLEFDILDAKKRNEFASTISSIREPRTTTGGVNFVIGFRPELWRDIVPNDAAPGVEGFNKAIRGTEGFVMPCTQHDAVVWLSGSAYDVIFDMARSIIHDLAGQASLAEETSS